MQCSMVGWFPFPKMIFFVPRQIRKCIIINVQLSSNHGLGRRKKDVVFPSRKCLEEIFV